MHWLIHFSIINQYQPLVQKIFKTLKQLIEPVLSRIRSILPSMNGLDLSPIVLFLLIYFIKDVIWQMSVA
jgi:YggT family protein